MQRETDYNGNEINQAIVKVAKEIVEVLNTELANVCWEVQVTSVARTINGNKIVKDLITKKGVKMKITTLVRKILDKDIRTVMEAGYIDADLTLTKKGEDELMGILFLEKKAELVKAAEEELKERKKSK